MNRIHVCLVSGQPMPNLIPLRMEELRPDRVILLVSPDMNVQANRLENLIKGWGVRVEKMEISPYDLDAVKETCSTILTQYHYDNVILNATGGTKIMAFAAFEVFRNEHRPILYVDTQDKRIDILSPEKDKIEFKSIMKIRPYLAAYGQHIISEDTPSEIPLNRQAVIDEIINNIGNLEKGISLLNGHASQYRGVRTFPFEIDINEKDLENDQFRAVISLFAQHGVFEFDHNRISFPTQSSVEFASGGWLEEYTFQSIARLNPTDVKMGVKVRWDTKRSSHPDNEYDVVFTNNNRLYLLECKTKRFSGRDLGSIGEEPIYKLENLRDDAGGLYGKGMLVSYRRLTDEQKRRLQANRLDYCDAANLKNIKEKIKKWME